MENKNIKKINIVFLLSLVFASTFVFAKTEVTATKEPALKSAQIQEKAKNSVVQMFSFSNEFNWLKPCEPPREGRGRGTGFFVDQRHIVTNFHVVEDSYDILYFQNPTDGKERFELEFIGGCPYKDVAVLRVKDKDFEKLSKKRKDIKQSNELLYLELGSSDNLEPLTKVIIPGYPLGQENIKFSSGDVAGSQSINGRNLIQTTAPVNPGNSGGPFLDENGKVVGIMASGIMGANGVGYFIRISDVENIINGFIAGKYDTKILKKPFWGAALQPLTQDTIEFIGLPVDHGARVCQLVNGALFDKYGIKKGDIIYNINGHDVDRFGYVNVDWSSDKVSGYEMIDRLDFGEEFVVSFYRKNENNVFEDLKIKCVVSIGEDLAISEKYPPFDEVDYIVLDGAVIMEFTENHLEILQEVVKSASKHNMFWISDVLKYAYPEEKNKSVLIITHIYAGTSIEDSRCFDVWDVVNKINGIEVKTLSEFRDAAGFSVQSNHVEIESADGRYISIPLEKLAEEESFLAMLHSPFDDSKLFSKLF